MSDSFHVEDAEALLHSHVFDVERRTIRHGDATFTRDVVIHSGAVAILAINDRGEIGLVRQYRSPFDRVTIEIPAGTLDKPDEEPLDAAKRELLEELGCEARSWTLLGRFMTATGWSNQVMTIYEASDLTLSERQPEGPEESSSTVLWLSPHDLRTILSEEDAVDSTMVVALHRVFGTFFDCI